MKREKAKQTKALTRIIDFGKWRFIAWDSVGLPAFELWAECYRSVLQWVKGNVSWPIGLLTIHNFY